MAGSRRPTTWPSGCSPWRWTRPGTAAERDFKSRLQEISQARLHLAPTYAVIAQQGPDHDKTFEVAILLGGKEYGRAQGKSKKEAQQNAAARALAVLQADDAARGTGS